jgi:DNA-binding transcriptional regulator YbjK
MEDEKGMRKIMEFMRLFAIIFLAINVYFYCFGFFRQMGWHWASSDHILSNFVTKTILFKGSWVTKTFAVVFLLLSCLGTKGRKDEKIKGGQVAGYALIGLGLLYGSDALLSIGLSPVVSTAIYVVLLTAGFLLLLSAGMWLGRVFSNDLMKDRFNKENESFPQEERLMDNEYSVNLRTEYQLQGKTHQGWINIVNPQRATAVLGTPGSGKSFAVVNEFIRQHLAKGYTMYVYDYKFDDLSVIAYNALLRNKDKFKKPVKFYVINFDDPRKSHRCNPLKPELMTDIIDAYESAATIMLNMNRTWIQKQGDFFVESPINILTMAIWFMRIYEENGVKGKYCTFPHVIEFINQSYETIFPILLSYPELANYARPFASALEQGALEQLEGQVASVRIPLSRITSEQLYWVMSGDDFTLDINDPENPKVLCIGNNPSRQAIYGAALGLYNARLIKLVNQKGKLKSSIIIDELPTIYFKGIDNLIATARSNKVSTCLAFQDFSQLERDYGKPEAMVIRNTVGNVVSGQVTGDSAESLSKRFGQVLQQRQSLSINMRETSTSLSTQMGNMIPASTISNLSQGNFVGAVADNFGEEIDQKVFHCKIKVDVKAIAAETKAYKPIPIIKNFVDANGVDHADEQLKANYFQIKQDVEDICKAEIARIKADTTLAHLIIEPKKK